MADLIRTHPSDLAIGSRLVFLLYDLEIFFIEARNVGLPLD